MCLPRIKSIFKSVNDFKKNHFISIKSIHKSINIFRYIYNP